MAARRTKGIEMNNMKPHKLEHLRIKTVSNLTDFFPQFDILAFCNLQKFNIVIKFEGPQPSNLLIDFPAEHLGGNSLNAFNLRREEANSYLIEFKQSGEMILVYTEMTLEEYAKRHQHNLAWFLSPNSLKLAIEEASEQLCNELFTGSQIILVQTDIDYWTAYSFNLDLLLRIGEYYLQES